MKVIVSMSGDTISQADINLKLPRPHAKDVYHNTAIREDVPWKLQQIQVNVDFLYLFHNFPLLHLFPLLQF